MCPHYLKEIIEIMNNTAGQLTKGVPYPDSSDPKKDLVAEGHFARRAFGLGWLVLVGFTVVLVPAGAWCFRRCLRTARAAGILGAY